jgi:predicted dehydrogenase
MKRKISVGMVGLGQFGTGFVKLFQDHPDVERVALCDLKPERVAACAERFGITETYLSLDEICKSDLDAIVLITQPWLHAPQAIQVMEYGKHVYTAVPVVTSPKGDGDEILTWCDRLVEVVERTGQLYMMGETSYYRPDVVYCRHKAREGVFGEIVYIESEYLHDTYLPHSNLIKVQMARTGKTEAEVMAMGGGVPMHYPTHSTSVPISITGARMTEVSAQGYIYPHDEYFREDSVTGNLFSNEVAVYRMSNGTLATVREFRRVGHVGREGIVKLLGTEASFERELNGMQYITKTEGQEVDVEAFRETGTPPLPGPLAANLGGHGGSHAYLVHEFVDACVNWRTPKINVWEAVRYVAAGVMAHKSALNDGELMKVPDWGDAPQDV